MKLLLLIMLCPLWSFAQWTDDFSTNLNNWFGDSSFYEIDSNQLLHLNAPPVASSTFLWHPSEALFNGVWQFYVRMDFNPSGSNYSLVHLSSDENNNGYFVKIGGAEDAISLHRNTNGDVTKIIGGTEGALNTDSVKVLVKVMRDSLGNWELLGAPFPSGNYTSQGTAFDNTHIISERFGIQCTYTQTRSDKFYFDDITVSGTAFQDTFYVPDYREIVINELMIDPSPPNDLPEIEYIEIKNNSDRTINLQHLSLSDISSKVPLPFYLLEANNYLLLCSDLSLFPNINNAMEINLPSLNNSSDSVRLLLHDSVLIDEVNYQENWHTVTTEGGISLEQINPFSLCSNAANWASCTHSSGGTPAYQNSVFNNSPDASPPELITIEWLTDTLNLIFDESATINTSSIGMPQGAGTNWQIIFTPPLEENKQHSITLGGVADCEGNEHAISVEFVVPDQAEKGDVILNEILFNPIDGDNDFVEIYNKSDKYIDLKNWQLANQYADSMTNEKWISQQSHIIYPQEIWVLCKDVNTLFHYHSSAQTNRIIEMSSLPAYSNEGGVVYLLCSGEVIDEFTYSEEMHFALLSSFDGVSLERISPTTNQWHSAAESVGFATPTLVNSQHNEGKKGTEIMTLSPDIFSPNTDGTEDILQIQIELEEVGFSGSLQIFSTQGVLVQRLANNVLFGKSNTFYWDGLSQKGTKAPIGRYIVLLKAFNTQGKIVKAKKTCVLGGQL